jgi:hypothetical protein
MVASFFFFFAVVIFLAPWSCKAVLKFGAILHQSFESDFIAFIILDQVSTVHV